MYPKISIVTPSWNQGPFIEKTIRSVLEQDYPNLEYIIIDGASTDGTVDIIRKYENHLAFWTSEKDRGQAHAINKGLERATGVILGWLNSDDCLERGALYTVAEHAGRYPEIGAFVGHGRIVDETGKQMYYKEPRGLTFEDMCQWLDHGNFMQPSCFFRRIAWEAAGPLDESIHIAFDVDLWLRMIRKATFQRIDSLLSTSLSHKSAKTTAFYNHMIVDCSIVILKAGGEKFVRRHLNNMASRLMYYETNFNKLMQHPLVRLIKPVGRLLVKPAVRRQDVELKW